MIRVSLAAMLLLLSGCFSGPAPNPGSAGVLEGELVVFAAASLADVFPEIADAFHAAHPGASVRFNFAGSQLLRAQLEFGAKADVFASADEYQMDLTIGSGLVSGSPVQFASNQLVVITPLEDGRDNTAHRVMVRDLGGLAQEGAKLALALPEVPVGVYTREVLQNLADRVEVLGPGYPELVLANAVTLDRNVRSVVQKVVLGEVDAGVVYRTDAATDHTSTKVTVLSIPKDANIVAGYPIATLKSSANPALSEAFVRFILMEQSQTILRSHGFGLSAAPVGFRNQPVATER